MGSVVTFYSYKGGVGRSMVLANVAVQLAKARQRVLMVDWDLEAPGLERYFHYFTRSTPRPSSGLLPMFMAATDGDPAAYLQHVDSIDVGDGTPLKLLSSGREQEPSLYARWLEEFDWKRFFRKGGGDFLEELRRIWKRDFDVVLIDSRTGLSDAGGVCTIQMPDVLVVMFTANYQSMLGARDAMRLVRQARQALAYPRMQLTVFPLPARFGGGSPSDAAQEWLVRFADEFGEFYEDWLPGWAEPKEVLDRVKVPQADEFGFGERLAVVEDPVGAPLTIGFACDQLAKILKDDFRAAHDVLGLRERTPPPPTEAPTEDYEWDLFVSAQGGGSTLVDRLIDDLRAELTFSYRPTSFFVDRQEIRLGEAWTSAISDALRKSRLLLSIITPGYVRSRWALAEWRSFEERERVADAGPLIVPVLLRGRTEDLPPQARERQFLVMTDYTTARSPAEMIRQLAAVIDTRLRNVPPFRQSFPVVEPEDVVVPPRVPFARLD
jgi:cellulose biosynthesis protein BcsQ